MAKTRKLFYPILHWHKDSPDEIFQVLNIEFIQRAAYIQGSWAFMDMNGMFYVVDQGSQKTFADALQRNGVYFDFQYFVTKEDD